MEASCTMSQLAIDERGGSDAGMRYTATAQALHWVAAACMFLVIPFGWVAVAMPEENAWSQVFFTPHKSPATSCRRPAATP